MIRIVCAVLAGLAVLLAPAGVRAEAAYPFLSYLEDEGSALVVFNPSGFDPRMPPAGTPYPAEPLRADLAALRPGYRAILLGIWDPTSEGEIAAAADLVRRWRDRLALAVAIGNEGINDNRYQIDDLARARDRLLALIGRGRALAITTSEPAGDYGWPPIRAFGDFLAPNIHPAIDHQSLPPDAAVAWVRGRAEAIAHLAGKPVLVKETGLPNGGGEPQSPDRQRAFWAEWLARGRLVRLTTPAANGSLPVFASYAAAFEAFDAPWKGAQVGDPIEAHWGILTVDRTPYPAFLAWVAAARH
ncbi:MAG: hypothetical protein IPK66_11925 [Rhodospirillales bacterium]|nr:hypothetical protein [Rhodospirillales bacterium]